ncbi:MAG TPA: DUF4149 domain-containing protein [Candidatus Angelobacter sp.]|nr:DUF4149 domain-containing protein [Candidatus Angelobacter sp.]
MWVLRTLMLLALVIWVGGIAFFIFVEAPTAFHVLPSTELAGNLVAPTLGALHWIGIVCGLAFLTCSVALSYAVNYRLRLLAAANLLVIVMLCLTAVSQFGVTPAMRDLRTQLTSADAPSQMDLQYRFQGLHHWSERLEGGVLLCGLAVVFLTARRGNP